jgi:hypothetical protein
MANRILFVLLIALAFSTAAPALSAARANGNPSIPLLRLELVLDGLNSDDIAIGFLSTATTQYNNQIDSRYLPGIDAPEGLSSLSSDNVALSVNVVPLPSAAPLIIRLDIEAQNSGPFTLQRTGLDSIPQVYDIWLMDHYAKDSLNLRNNTSYAFNINKNDTLSFGHNRFTVVIRQNPALLPHLLSFTAKKGTVGNELSWTTENEQSNTAFYAERSIDGGTTFLVLDSLSSDGSGSYSFIDKSPISGSDLYRLKMQDMNGNVIYSNVASVDDAGVAASGGRSNSVNIYPNPSNGVINLSINTVGAKTSQGAVLKTSAIGQSFAARAPANTSGYAIRIMNIKGAIVKSATSTSANWQDNLSSLPPGTYIVQVTDAGNNTVVGKSTFVKM